MSSPGCIGGVRGSGWGLYPLEKGPSMASDLGRALVTGASSGIGAAFAEAIAHRGQDLILTARRTDRLEEMATRLRSESDVEVEVITADLTQESDVARLEEALSSDDRLTLLVNNAGFGGYRP